MDRDLHQATGCTVRGPSELKHGSSPVKYPITPDGRYFVVRERLWRCSNPELSTEQRAELVRALMSARRSKRDALRAGDDAAREAARLRVDAAKIALGERGPVWWKDGSPDFNRHHIGATPYADWFAELPASTG
jgi:hypothetical protein